MTWVSGPTSGIGNTDDSELAAVYVVSRRRGDSFNAPQLIGQTPYGEHGVQVAIGATGRITVLWDGTSNDIQAASGTAGGTLGAPHAMTPDTGIASITIAVTQRNQAVAIWERKGPEGGEGRIETAMSHDGAHFGTPRRISKINARITDCSNPHLTLARTGTVLAEWQCLASTPEHTVDEFTRYQP